MALIHWSEHPITSVKDAIDPVSEGSDNWKIYFKPTGLWVSVGDGDDSWRAWCEGENFRLECLKYATEVILQDDANILTLSTATDIDIFTMKFYNQNAIGISSCDAIDWPKVMAQYEGIIIAPYIYTRRLSDHTMWYYAWDCASGCIWRARAIKELKPWGNRNGHE